MPVNDPIKSRSVLGATELTLMAPLKSGLINAQDTRSYELRATMVLSTLNALGISRREVDPTPGIVEVAGTIRAIRSFRVGIVGPLGARQVLLAVAFDGGWEPYMRRIWRDLGPLLDVIFFNCDGYLLSTAHDFPAYAAWVRSAQVETSFYYEDSPMTVSDLMLLRDGKGQPDPAPPPAAGTPFDQGRAALVALYRLSDMHPQTQDDDAGVLRRAAQLLMPNLAKLASGPCGLFPVGEDKLTPVERAAWAWFAEGICRKPQASDPTVPQDQEDSEDPPPDLSQVQAGILDRYEDLAHGCLVLVELDSAAAARGFIDHLSPEILPADARPFRYSRAVYVNLAFTYAGLQRVGLDAGTLQQLPEEFRQGMEARAGILGDWRYNHPNHWNLPQAYRAEGRVDLSRVHAIVQLSSTGSASTQWQDLDDPGKQAIAAELQALADKLGASGRILAVQPMQRYPADNGTDSRGHFGFVDGISQPRLGDPEGKAGAKVKAGDLLLGYPNSLGDRGISGPLWVGSTFAVIRKLRQYPARLRQQVPGQAEREGLMGRHENGDNLVDHKPGNDFDYEPESPPQAPPIGPANCPLFSHVRRANPRKVRDDVLGLKDLVKIPRILRRGMSYGPKLPDAAEDDGVDRGLVFIAYNASIAEQFEVIQGWLAGGNSSGPGSFSGQRDPFLGVALEGDPRRYAWTDASGVSHQVDLPADQPLVTLQWGLYAFVPSLVALRSLRDRADERAKDDLVTNPDAPTRDNDPDAVQRKRDQRTRRDAMRTAMGGQLIKRLLFAEQALGRDAAVAQWKLALEDMGSRMAGVSQAIWTTVRLVYGGVLRTPYGVLVGSRLLVAEVLDNLDRRYSATGYNARLGQSFGEIYLGRDEGKAYHDEADPANAAIMDVTADQAYDSAFRHTVAQLQKLSVPAAPDGRVLDVKDLVDGMLADFCTEWFGLPEPDTTDGPKVLRGWYAKPTDAATCPGHFMPPSRCTFQPQPGEEARRTGEEAGKTLKPAVLDYVAATRGAPARQGRLGQKLFAAFSNDERLASNLIGVMMGLLPTVDGNLRSVMFEWTRDRTLWQQQAALRSLAQWPSLAQAHSVLSDPLEKAMQLRPVPEVIWRTALQAHTLGAGPSAVEVRPGDVVAVSLVSAAQEGLDLEKRDAFVVFGGNRRLVTRHPQHACPGYDMAHGLMLGFLAALMTQAQLRPATSPVTLNVSV